MFFAAIASILASGVSLDHGSCLPRHCGMVLQERALLGGTRSSHSLQPRLGQAGAHAAVSPYGSLASFIGTLARQLSEKRCSRQGGLSRMSTARMAAAGSGAKKNAKKAKSPAGQVRKMEGTARAGNNARKAKAREEQARKAEQKTRAEKQYFDECRREALSNARTNSKSVANVERVPVQSGSPGINFEKYDDVKVELKGPGSDGVIPLDAFESLGSQVPGFLMESISQMGYARPTPIQKYAVPLALSGSDLMCCAQTGSGKTAAFLLPICSALAGAAAKSRQKHLDSNAAQPRALILAPTRELVLQIQSEATKLCSQSGMRPVAVIGGANQRKQIQELALGADIVIATPGRLVDFLFNSKIVQLRSVEFLVLDEADRMLDMGFEPQLRRIMEGADMPTKTQRQTLLFSATFPKEMQVVAQKYLSPHVWVGVGRIGAAADGISQRVLKSVSDKRLKLKQVAELLRENQQENTIVFVNAKHKASWVKKMLCNGGAADAPSNERFAPILADEIHGGRSQAQRIKALEAFREGRCRVLVATDVAARGLDIPAVGHVINMDLPAKADFESFVHRVGRTGRAGRLGCATSLFVPSNEPKWGNSDIARPLVKTLREAKQDVPQWLEQLAK